MKFGNVDLGEDYWRKKHVKYLGKDFFGREYDIDEYVDSLKNHLDTLLFYVQQSNKNNAWKRNAKKQIEVCLEELEKFRNEEYTDFDIIAAKWSVTASIYRTLKGTNRDMSETFNEYTKWNPLKF